MKFRLDINGLRAVAVLLVIANHLNIRMFDGGFIGVDIFFVISGYLISSIILKEIKLNSFTLLGFYSRRVLRIVPALSVMILFAYTISYFTLFPFDFKFFSVSASFSILGFANIFFSLLSGGYFSPRTELFPLAHTWSLGVEEQFYFVLPLVLMILSRLFNEKKLLFVFFLLFLFFLCVSIYGANYSGTISYYLPQYRVFELLLGTLISISKFKITNKSSLFANVSFLSLIIMSLVFNDKIIFPGMNAFYICLATGIFIITDDNVGFVKKMLACKLFQYIGNISYSLYLYHWPVIAILKYRNIEFTPLVIFYYLIFIFSISSLSYYLIEQKFRKVNLGLKNNILNFYIMPSFFIGVLSLYIYFSGGLSTRYPETVREIVTSYDGNTDLRSECSINDHENISKIYNFESNCIFHKGNKSKPSVLLIGDSHANHLRGFLSELLSETDLSAVYNVQGSCYAGEGYANNDSNICAQRNIYLANVAKNYDYIVLGGVWEGYYIDDLTVMITDIKRSQPNVKILLFQDVYRNTKTHQCPARYAMRWINDGCDQAVDKKIQASNYLLERFESENVKLIDLNELFCDEEMCTSLINNKPIYRDTNHLNNSASRELGKKWLEKHNNPFLE